MNRETWRQVRKMPWREAEAAIHSVYDPIVRERVMYAHKNDFASFFTALHDRYPEMSRDEMLSIAQDVVEYANGLRLETPEELADRLVDEIGVDIRNRVEDHEFNYIPCGEQSQTQC